MISLQDVSVVYDGPTPFIGLIDVNLAIETGERVALLGRSGSGKSTLLSVLGLMKVPSTGHYALNGADTSGGERFRSAIRASQVGFIFQAFHLIAGRSVLDNVEIGMLYAGIERSERRDLAAAAILSVGLELQINKRVELLSGGQCQRVAIARAIAPSPPVVLADEPTGNLDARTGGETLEILMGLADRGHTIVCATHDQSVAGSASRRVEIEDGRVVADVRQ